MSTRASHTRRKAPPVSFRVGMRGCTFDALGIILSLWTLALSAMVQASAPAARPSQTQG